MIDYSNTYCKIYLDSETDKGQLLDQIAKIVSGSVRMRTVYSSGFQADLVTNEDFDETKRAQNSDQFLFYRYYLDIEPTGVVTQEEYVESLGRLLIDLWRLGYRAVASCDFESELPQGGGYKSPSAE